MKKTLLRSIYGALVSLFCLIAAQAQTVINSFSPLSGPVSTTVTIVGTGFNTTASNNVVFFGPTKATVQSVAGSTTLTVIVPYGANYQYISVTNLGTNLTGFSATPFVVTFSNNGTFTFTSDPTISSANSPYRIALGDLNADGKPDLVLTNYVTSGSTGSCYVYLNTSTSSGALSYSFSSAQTISSSNSADGVALKDIDGDGRLDIILSLGAQSQSAGLAVLRNTTVPLSNVNSIIKQL